ncbi:hypothetical protein [Pseudoalteromonas ruthenica]|uniref:hypothetical protein n=1 Tax=Pseudoalteromonas ruthenica TaxID=151081 RepID=UPI00110A8266|nr:hypothetical protein [Pseudoalteromonas ruthenica]TMO47269.1 hypothetical protein CWC24_08325 [Pseudoalteromonas ruthenica]TMO48134.1 hypothetical protein CWC23_18055 [Pseudoalteromonas ruthenica]
MKVLFVFLLAVFSSNTFAVTYLCVAEAGAGVKNTGSVISAEVYDVSDNKYVISDESGDWKFKSLGNNSSALTCDTEYFCEVKGGFASVFFRSNDGIFTYIFQTAIDEKAKNIITYTIKGYCSAL